MSNNRYLNILLGKDWVNSSARRFFDERNFEDGKLFDKINKCVELIQSFWDESYFTEKELDEQLVCICEGSFNGENVGICVKKEPDEKLYHVILNGIIGTYDIIETDDDWELIFDENAQNFTVFKSYLKFPTKDELIDDFISLDILEKQSPVITINNIPIYPTAKEYF